MIFHWNKAVLWQYCVVGNNKTLLGLHVNFPTPCPILTKSGFTRNLVMNVSYTKFRGNLFGGSRAETRGLMDKGTDGGRT